MKTPWYRNYGNASAFVLAVIALLGLMVASIYYTGSSGQSLGVIGFLQLWFREIIILGFLVGLFVAVGVGKFRKASKGSSRE